MQQINGFLAKVQAFLIGELLAITVTFARASRGAGGIVVKQLRFTGRQLQSGFDGSDKESQGLRKLTAVVADFGDCLLFGRVFGHLPVFNQVWQSYQNL